jgi:hypothetical protein
MKNVLLAAAAAATVLAFAASGASAAPFTGTISTFGNTTGTGPWDLTSEPVGPGSGLAIAATSSITFSQLTDIDAVFQDIAGGAYGGSPRFSIGFVGNPNFLHIALGTSPNFNDSDPALFTAGWSGTNVIGNNDTGRYDLSQFGGSVFTDYAAALALLGNLSIEEIDIVVDAGWGPNGRQELLLCNMNINGTSFGTGCSTREVDDAATLPVMAAGMALGFLALRRKRKPRSAA